MLMERTTRMETSCRNTTKIYESQSPRTEQKKKLNKSKKQPKQTFTIYSISACGVFCTLHR